MTSGNLHAFVLTGRLSLLRLPYSFVHDRHIDAAGRVAPAHTCAGKIFQAQEGRENGNVRDTADSNNWALIREEDVSEALAWLGRD